MDTTEKTEEVPARTSDTTKIILSILVALLLIAVIVLAVMQMQTGRKMRADLDSLRSSVETLRGSVESTTGTSQQVASLAAKVDALAAENSPTAQSLDAVRKDLASIRADVATLKKPGKTTAADVCPEPADENKQTLPPSPPQAAPAGDSGREEILAELGELKKRLEGLKTDVKDRETTVVKETKVIQTQISDVKDRIGDAEAGVAALRESVEKADLPELQQKVESVRQNVAHVEGRVQKLSQDTAQFQGQMKTFFKQVFYNDPWEQMTAKED
jgi:uncharacterized coiled-coil DUF342 family protein